jgi:hypothetical protein
MTRADNKKMIVRLSGVQSTVLLVLVAVIFGSIGFYLVRWKRDSERRGCLMNIRNVQQSMRSYSGVNGIGAGESRPFPRTNLVGPGNFLVTEPVCPSGGTYIWIEDRVPQVGELMVRCSCRDHVPQDHSEW